MLTRPLPETLNEGYAHYVKLAPEADLLEALHNSLAEMRTLAAAFGRDREDHRYAPGKWSVKEVFQHLVDAERNLSYKAFATSRNDQEVVLYHPKWEVYLAGAEVGRRSLADIVGELESVRAGTVTLFRHMSDVQGERMAQHANDYHRVSAATMGYCIAGHMRHHLGTLRERYLAAVTGL